MRVSDTLLRRNVACQMSCPRRYDNNAPDLFQCLRELSGKVLDQGGYLSTLLTTIASVDCLQWESQSIVPETPIALGPHGQGSLESLLRCLRQASEARFAL